MSRRRTSGTGRRFELVLIRLRPPVPRTVGLIAKHAGPHSYHWILLTDRHQARPSPLARLLSVAYLDEASGVLGRGDPRWAVPRAYLRRSGDLDTEDRPRWDSEGLAPVVRRELARIAAWLRAAHRPYLEELAGGLLAPTPGPGFRLLTDPEAERRGFADPTGRALIAPPPPPVVTGTMGNGDEAPADRADWLPWRRSRLPG